ncbi:MAG: type II/IV secretion system protein, partial [Magnetococcales bacterium]|nr:type II/IV secretion system protein [Magnetococcales bacterium]
LPYGMILLTGPTGSGKSTTLRAAISFVLAQEKRHVLTVEDPVEVKVPGVTQVQVNTRIHYTFAKALRHFLRHDPDVIMVGEIRDEETARIAVQAALTGHLVLSTLHTNDAPGAATRLVDMGVEPYLVSSALTLVIAQRLVRLLCVQCREAYEPSGDDLRALASMGHLEGADKLYRNRGCPKCYGTGFKGRTVIYEMLMVDEVLKELISQRTDAVVLRREARNRGFVPLLGVGVKKVLEGRTTLSEVASFLDTMGGFL